MVNILNSSGLILFDKDPRDKYESRTLSVDKPMNFAGNALVLMQYGGNLNRHGRPGHQIHRTAAELEIP